MLDFPPQTQKDLVFDAVTEYLHQKKLNIDKEDRTRPWGGFFVLDESQA